MPGAAMGRPLRLLHVEDDSYQQFVLAALVEAINEEAPKLSVELTAVDTAQAAIEATRNAAFDLVLLDYRLPGGDADTILAQLRQQVENAAIIVLSGDAQEASMQRCWLDLGADSYRVKPITKQICLELLLYTRDKQRHIQKRGRQPYVSDDDDESDDYDGDDDASSHRSKSFKSSRECSFKVSEPEQESAASIMQLLSGGRRGPVHLALDQTIDLHFPVAMKVYALTDVRGPPPPPHAHVNAILKRRVKGEQCVEMRRLCEGGELFDLLGDAPDGLPLGEALTWFAQLASAVQHCHAHGAVHGQLHAENVLLDGGMCSLAVTGFSQIDEIVSSDESAPTRRRRPSSEWTQGEGGEAKGAAGRAAAAAARRLSETALVQLRPVSRSSDAPELQGRTHASARELADCDVWALGMLLCSLMTGSPSPRALPDVDTATGQDALPVALHSMSLTSSRAGSLESLTSLGPDVAMAETATAQPAVAPSAPARAQCRGGMQARLVGLCRAMMHADPKQRPSASEVYSQLVA